MLVIKTEIEGTCEEQKHPQLADTTRRKQIMSAQTLQKETQNEMSELVLMPVMETKETQQQSHDLILVTKTGKNNRLSSDERIQNESVSTQDKKSRRLRQSIHFD